MKRPSKFTLLDYRTHLERMLRCDDFDRSAWIRHIKAEIAIVDSMTPLERERPFVVILDVRRRRRIARGSGTTSSAVREMIGLFEEMKRRFESPTLDDVRPRPRRLP